MLEAVTSDRVLFGSRFPFYSFESALLKFRESSLEPPAKKAIEEGNARRLQHKD
jgi:predicted TIM-barrel fold metal-dependent hydrolase